MAKREGRANREERNMLARMDPQARSAYQQTARLRRNGATGFTVGGQGGNNVYGSGFRRNGNRSRTL